MVDFTVLRPLCLAMLAIAAAVVIFAVAGVHAKQPAAPAPSVPALVGPQPPIPLADLWCQIACASSSNPRGRWSEPSWVARGPGGVAAGASQSALDLYARGWRRFYVDSPFGKDTDTKGVPQFTFFGPLRRGHEPWTVGFDTSWRRVTSLEGVRVIAYLGNPYADAAFRQAAEGGNLKTALRMVREAVAPLKAAGFHGIALDATEDTDEDHWMGELIKLLELMGFDVLIESTPRKRQAWLTRYGTVRTTWFNRYLVYFEDSGAFFDPSACRGERIEIFNGTPWDEDLDGRPFKDWGELWMRRTLQLGMRPALSPYGWDPPELNVGPIPAESER